MEGLKLPAGEVYSYTEGGNGELGFYIVSDGSGTPYRVRIRAPRRTSFRKKPSAAWQRSYSTIERSHSSRARR
jgi:NADH:ubiquinone oxidoreductase subunit D